MVGTAHSIVELYYTGSSFRTYTFQDHLGLVRGTKSRIEDGYDTGTSLRHVVAVGDFAGAQPLRL